MHTAASGSSTNAARAMDSMRCTPGVVRTSNQASTTSIVAAALAAVAR
ncbi:MAG TPA: hypothetical protein VFV73_04025 [Streptosporangiaceae bacterium]|nr:hypothetical protein [Streptosporangiaceae bacterium]